MGNYSVVLLTYEVRDIYLYLVPDLMYLSRISQVSWFFSPYQLSPQLCAPATFRQITMRTNRDSIQITELTPMT